MLKLTSLTFITTEASSDLSNYVLVNFLPASDDPSEKSQTLFDQQQTLGFEGEHYSSEPDCLDNLLKIYITQEFEFNLH